MITVNDILEAMRSKNVFYLEEANLAVVETTGQISIYPDPEAKTNIDKAGIPPDYLLFRSPVGHPDHNRCRLPLRDQCIRYGRYGSRDLCG